MPWRAVKAGPPLDPRQMRSAPPEIPTSLAVHFPAQMRARWDAFGRRGGWLGLRPQPRQARPALPAAALAPQRVPEGAEVAKVADGIEIDPPDMPTPAPDGDAMILGTDGAGPSHGQDRSVAVGVSRARSCGRSGISGGCSRALSKGGSAPFARRGRSAEASDRERVGATPAVGSAPSRQLAFLVSTFNESPPFLLQESPCRVCADNRRGLGPHARAAAITALRGRAAGSRWALDRLHGEILQGDGLAARHGGDCEV